jgi:DNA polymerase III, epsilon subunit and related 3''-5'' exonucleases
MFDFTAIDFETADSIHPCSLGLAVIKDSQVVLEKQWLIKPSCYPYFHYYARKIHGISKEDVKNKPTFNCLWKEIKPFIEGQILVAHNSDFDVKVLLHALEHYHIEKPEFTAYCSCKLARYVWPKNAKASLDFLCKQEGISLEHHQALSDAKACALLFLKELSVLDIKDFSELSKLKVANDTQTKLLKQQYAIARSLRKAMRIKAAKEG